MCLAPKSHLPLEKSMKGFFVYAKSFEISVEGEGKKLKVVITERCRGLGSGIRFGEGGLKNFLKGFDSCSRVSSQSRRVFDWKENGRFYRLERRENAARRYLLCSVLDVDGKRHKLFFPEGKSLING